MIRLLALFCILGAIHACYDVDSQGQCHACLVENKSFGNGAVAQWCPTTATCHHKGPDGRWDTYDDKGRSSCRDALDDPGTLITNPHFCNPDAGPVETPVELQVSAGDPELSDNWRKLKNAVVSVVAFNNAGHERSNESEVSAAKVTVPEPVQAPATAKARDEQWQHDMVLGRIPLQVPALYR